MTGRPELDDVRQQAVDLLREVLSWRLNQGRWAAVERAVDTVASALAAGDPQAVDEAVYELELLAPDRAVGAGASTGIEDPFRERIGEMLHPSGGLITGDETSG